MLAKTPRAKPPFKLVPWESDEFAIHISVVDAVKKFAAPGVLFFHPANGEQRTIQAGRRLKRMGLLPGTADLLFLRSGAAPLFLEIKTSRGVQSESQRAFEMQAVAAGARYEICRSLDEALVLLWQRGYLAQKLTA